MTPTPETTVTPPVSQPEPPLSPQGLALYDQLIAQHEQVAQQKQAELAQLYTLIDTMKRLRAGAQDGT